MGRETRTGGREATEGVITSRFLSVGKPRTEAPEGFEWTPLTSVARLETGHTPARKHPEYWDGDIPWIGIRDATANHGRTIHSTRERVTQAGVDNSSTRLLPADTVCLSRTASVGYVVTMGVPMCTSQDFVNWVCGPDLNHRYLKNVLVGEHHAMLRFAHGTTHQTIYFPEVKAFHACLPDRHTQDSIADTLGALDDKVESNARVARVLFDLARNLMGGSTRVRVGDVASLDKGLSYKGAGLVEHGQMQMVNLSNFKASGLLDRTAFKFYDGEYKPRHLVRRRDLVIANTDLTQQRVILGRPALLPSDIDACLFTHHVFAVRFTDDNALTLPLWAALGSVEFRDRAEGFATGTTVAGLPKDAVLGFEFAVPDDSSVIDESWNLIERAWAAERESEDLAALRDALLPELLSGRLRVREAEELVSDVT